MIISQQHLGIEQIMEPINLNPFYPRIENKRNSFFSKINSFHLKFRVYKFLDHPSGWHQTGYHIFLLILTISTLVISMVNTSKRHVNVTLKRLYIAMEIIVTLLYTCEFILRIWSCSVNECYKGKFRIKYMRSVCMIIDTIILLTSFPLIVLLFFQFSGKNKINLLITILKFIQLIRLFRFERYFSSMSSMLEVLKIHRDELVTGYSCVLFIMIITSFVIFIVEKSSIDTGIYNVTDSIYFTMTSFLTIGYGDIVPSNNVSRAFIVFLALIGVALTAVPSGIIGSGFAIHAARKAKEKRGREIKKPAGILLQRAVRNFLYQSDGSATEKMDFKTVINNTKKNPFLIQAAILKTRFLGDTQDQTFEETLLTKTSMNETMQPTVWLDGIILTKKEKKNLAKFLYFNENIQMTIKISAAFVRYLQLEASAKKFRTSKHPISIDESIEVLQNEQNRLANYLEEVSKDVFIIKQSKTPLLDPYNSDKLKKPCSSSTNLTSMQDASSQLSELDQKIESLDILIKRIVEKRQNII